DVGEELLLLEDERLVAECEERRGLEGCRLDDVRVLRLRVDHRLLARRRLRRLVPAVGEGTRTPGARRRVTNLVVRAPEDRAERGTGEQERAHDQQQRAEDRRAGHADRNADGAAEHLPEIAALVAPER